MPVLRSVVDAVTVYCTVDTGNGAVERRIVDSAERLRSRHRLDVRSANYFDALHRVDVPDTDGPVAGAGDDLLLIKLDAVDTIGVARKVCRLSGLLRTHAPLLLEHGACAVHLLPFLFGVVGQTGARSTNLDWSG